MAFSPTDDDDDQEVAYSPRQPLGFLSAVRNGAGPLVRASVLWKVGNGAASRSLGSGAPNLFERRF